MCSDVIQMPNLLRIFCRLVDEKQAERLPRGKRLLTELSHERDLQPLNAFEKWNLNDEPDGESESEVERHHHYETLILSFILKKLGARKEAFERQLYLNMMSIETFKTMLNRLHSNIALNRIEEERENIVVYSVINAQGEFEESVWEELVESGYVVVDCIGH
jgi:hypothetical protein